MKAPRIFIFSVLAAVALGVVYYFFFRPAPAVYQGRKGEYSLSIFNHKGERISKRRGRLRLLLDPFTIYRNYPNQDHGSYSIDENGFRKGYRDREAPRRVMVIGGSAAFGQGLENNDQTFASLLSRKSGEYDVLNAAVVGFLSGQELAGMVQRLDSFRPDLYIVFDGWNDVFDPLIFSGGLPRNFGPIGFNNTFLVIEARLRNSYLREHGEAGEIPDLPQPGRTLDKDEYFEKIVRTYLENLSRMAAFARSRGAKFLVVFQPEVGNMKTRSNREEKYLRKWERSYDYLKKRVPERYRDLLAAAGEFCAENNIPYIDINEEPEFSENSQTLFYDVVHPNPAGHAIIAELIGKKLETLD